MGSSPATHPSRPRPAVRRGPGSLGVSHAVSSASRQFEVLRVTFEGRAASQCRPPRRPSRDRFACTGEDVATPRDAAQRRPTAHEHQMTDLPDSTSDEETPAGDPELAALVRPDAPRDAGDPELAALVRRDTPVDTSSTFEPGVDADTALFPVVAVTDDEPPARPRRRRSLVLRFGVSFVVAFLLTVGIGVRRPVRMGPAVRGPGPARRPGRQHGTRRAHPRAGGGGAHERLWVARDRAGHAHRPERPDDDHQLRRPRPRPQHLCGARRGTRGRAARASPSRTSSAHPRPRIHGVTLDSAVAYDHDKLAAAVETLADDGPTRPP